MALLSFCPDSFEEVKLKHLEGFLGHIRKNNSGRTANHHLFAIRSFYNWLELNYDIPNIAKKLIHFEEEPPCQRILTEEEYRKLTLINPPNRDIVMFLCNTGLRASEFLSLDIPPDGFLVVKGKGSKFRKIPQNSIVKQILQKYHFNLSKELICFRGRKWLWRVCGQVAIEAKIPHFSPHSCRHYFASTLYNHNTPILLISKLLGHSSVTTTEIYLHVDDSKLLGATDCLL